MFKNVLVGVDGSANGRDAIALARQLTDLDGKIILAHVHRGERDFVKGVQRELLREDGEASSKLLEDERYGPVKRLMLGSTSNYLARHAGCSLLVLPHGVESQADADAGAEREPAVGVAG